jgi:hypothetical protein
MGNIVFTNDEITAMVTPAVSTISTIGDRVSVIEAKIDELYKIIEKL